MEETTFLREHRISLDRTIADVMPETWLGHARIIIRQSDSIAGETERQALKSIEASIAERDTTAQKAAKAFIEMYEQT
jgi:hypothetical protein